jgi:hypothetical protein
MPDMRCPSPRRECKLGVILPMIRWRGTRAGYGLWEHTREKTLNALPPQSAKTRLTSPHIKRALKPQRFGIARIAGHRSPLPASPLPLWPAEWSRSPRLRRSPREAEDGPGAIALLECLASAEDEDEDAVKRATARVGRLVETFDAIDAARELERRANKAAEDALQIGELVVPKEHQGDVALNNWIAAVMSIYKRITGKGITGKGPGTSVAAPGSVRRGTAAGPLIRFLGAAGKPLGIQLSPDSWRGRVRLLTDKREK